MASSTGSAESTVVANASFRPKADIGELDVASALAAPNFHSRPRICVNHRHSRIELLTRPRRSLAKTGFPRFSPPASRSIIRHDSSQDPSSSVKETVLLPLVGLLGNPCLSRLLTSFPVTIRPMLTDTSELVVVSSTTASRVEPLWIVNYGRRNASTQVHEIAQARPTSLSDRTAFEASRST